MDSEYQYDAFDDGSSRMVGDKHLSKMEDFLKEFSGQLRSIEEALRETISEVWDPLKDPISLNTTPYEQTNIIHLINTENTLFNKVLLVFASLGKETNSLVKIAREKFYTPFLLFGQETNRETPDEGEAQQQIGRMLPFLQDLSNFVNRAYSVVRNYINQLASLYNVKEQLYQNSFKNVHFGVVFYTLGELLTCLVTLDEIIGHNAKFKQSWNMYKRMTKNIKEEPERYNVQEEQLMQFEKYLLSLEGQLLDGLIFQNCIEQEFDFPGLVVVRSNEILEREFLYNIKDMYSRMTARSGDLNEVYQRKHFIGLCSLYAFHFTIFRKIGDKKFFKAVWELHKVIPVVHLCGDIVWFPTEFLTKRVPYMVKNTIGSPDIHKFQLSYTAELDKTFLADVAKYYLQVTTWMVRMETALTNRAKSQRKVIETRVQMFMSGLHLAFEIGDLFKHYLYLHTFLRRPIKPSRIRPLCQCIEMLKSIKFTFHRKLAMVGENIAYMIQHIQFELQRAFFPIKDKLESTNKFSHQRLDTLAAATLAMQMLNGCATTDRRLILRLCMNVLFQLSGIKDEKIDAIKDQVRQLDVISSLELALNFATDCTFFYWSRALLPPYFKDIYENPDQVQKLPYMFAALQDAVAVFKTVSHVDPALYLELFNKELFTIFEEQLLLPLCRAIEVDLRLHIHYHLEIAERDPFRQGVKNLAALVSAKPFYFIDRLIDIKEYTKNYLDEIFYNLTTVALYDWQTYAEMRNLAQEKYNLELAEVHLPGQTLEQGVDVLEIMRNIHIFVAEYYYNLNTQVFIERNSEGKFLNTVNASHIANSLRTHGAGIMNTAVNFTYQFLQQKFVIFSQFLYDDHVKSKLYKDIRHFRETKEELDSKYPWSKAEEFNSYIRKLGAAEDGSSYLDAFRNLVTEIGNAMGFIRMVRSGGLYYTSNAIKFVPDLQNVAKFEEMATAENLSNATQNAAKNLDSALDGLTKNFAEGTDYFKMLVAAFAPEFRNVNNVHLRNFYMIIPPLTLSFVNYMLSTKDKVFTTRKGQTPSYCFCDDGFATGVAYILKLLDQNVDYDSLHWFESLKEKFRSENVKLEQLVQLEKRGAKRTSKEQQTAQLTLKKNNLYLKEFELLEYSFSGARIFFKNE